MSPKDQSILEPQIADRLGQTLSHTFKDSKLLELACIHKSFGNENRTQEPISTRDNERMEFLGDAILDLIVSEMLLEAFPRSAEGDLSKMRAGLVNERSLAKIAKQLKLGDYVLLGKGEENTGGREKESILASTFEAVVAAIYLDSGFTAAQQWTTALFKDLVKGSKEFDSLRDYKTRLQEVVQARLKCAPQYEVLQSMGPDHDKTFEVQLIVNGNPLAKGMGKSKKEAEQNAAKTALDQLLGLK